jgi:hypothetical protein
MIVEITYDTGHGTWNVMYDGQCLAFFHNIIIENCKLDAIDVWLNENPEYKAI